VQERFRLPDFPYGKKARMPEYTLTEKNGCQRCGKDAHVVFRKDHHDLPALKQRVYCDSRCLGGGVLDEATINQLALMDPP
jgi:hypothetical protein